MSPPTAFLPAAPVATRAAPLLSAASASSFVSPQAAPAQPTATGNARRPAAAPRMLFGFKEAVSATTESKLFGIFHRKSVVDIPQRDTAHAAERAAQVAEARETYVWSYGDIGDAGMVAGLPIPEELPEAGWILKVAKILVRVALNGATEDVDSKVESSVAVDIGRAVTGATAKVLTGQGGLDDVSKFIETIAGIYRSSASGVGRTLDDYKDLYNTISPDTVVKLDQFLRDDIFGWYRIAGPNPMRINKLTGDVKAMFPDITDDILRGISGFDGDSLAAMAADGRLFYVNYSELDGIPTGELNGVPKNLYMFAPRCLLGVPKDTSERSRVLPIAVYCGQGADSLMFTANRAHTDEATWVAAKFSVQASDALVHESVYHLGRCHLLMEAMLCSMHRSLPESHPLHRLLKPSFYGTVLINSAAVTRLINDGGTIDQITAPDVGLTREISANSVIDPSFSFNDWMPDRELASRGVTADAAAALHFPYRDDALAHWAALLKFVETYVYAYYRSDEDVTGDGELAAFCAEVTAAGKIHGFGDGGSGLIRTRAYLVRAMAMILFTASVQHAAVNFPQSTLMQFAPAMPLGASAPAPPATDTYKTINEWVNDMVPDLPKAEKQLQTAETIGVLRYGMIGEYGKDLDFAPEEVGEALELYQEELGKIGAKIQERNKRERLAGLPVYNYLVPKNIPMSINI